MRRDEPSAETDASDESEIRYGALPPDSSAEEESAGDDRGSVATSRRGRGGMPTWLKTKLARARELRAAGAIFDDVDDLAQLPAPTVGEPERILVKDGVPARLTSFASDHVHGEWRLDEIKGAELEPVTLLTGDPALASVDLERAIYLDTETTGLSGGAGVYVFLTGLGFFEGGEFHVWQGFLRDPGDERAVLAEVAERVRRASALVTFFGKSFDRHRLEDKMRIAGVDPPFDGLPHLDLYHPFRRLAKGRAPDGRLQTMERTLCGLARESDLPGSHAPAAWFDFLGDRAHRLEGVFQHNEDDVLSLVTLAAYLGRVIREERVDGTPLDGCPFGRARAVARAYFDRGDRGAAVPWLDRALDCADNDTEARELCLLRADALRLSGDHDAARAAYEELVQPPEDVCTVRAHAELAKLLEHRFRDLEAALEACDCALSIIEQPTYFGQQTALRRDLDKRRERLAKKLESS